MKKIKQARARPKEMRKSAPKPAADQTKQTAIKKTRFLKVFARQSCNVSKACAAARICRATFYEWKNTDLEFAAQVSELEEADLDYSEGALHKKIRKGVLAAIIFHLKCKAKHRGYIEKTEYGGQLTLTHQMSMDDLNKSLAACEKEAKR